MFKLKTTNLQILKASFIFIAKRMALTSASASYNSKTWDQLILNSNKSNMLNLKKNKQKAVEIKLPSSVTDNLKKTEKKKK
jgi:hypothetical protein